MKLFNNWSLGTKIVFGVIFLIFTPSMITSIIELQNLMIYPGFVFGQLIGSFGLVALVYYLMNYFTNKKKK